ncbi:MAG: 16S rRNA (guanine(527)-N(7))-methyltransferase RsmG [Oscillospiraceae bacterium]|nr:16S rRNA (guanine(527)-N(7))-methyltransferase RsmG [Oscillospiraceae bacterium]
MNKEMTGFKDLYKEIFENNNLPQFISDELIQKFAELTAEMLRVNEYMNLTAITDTSDIIAKHYADSLLIAESIPHGASVIDIGSGAGFPALPLAVARPDLHITALDSTGKKTAYISDTAKLLGVNINVINARAEIAGHDKKHRERYDVACARAVAPLNVLMEYCLPFVKFGGKFIAMKGADINTEIDDAENAVVILGGEIAENKTFMLYQCEVSQKRNIIIIQKNKPTPIIYPRNNAQITKNPL